MIEREFEKCELFLYAYRHGWKLGGKCPEMIALVIRNRVMAGWSGENGYGDLGVIQESPRVHYSQSEPPRAYPDFRDPLVRKFTLKCDDIVDRRVADEGLAGVMQNGKLVPALYWIDIGDVARVGESGCCNPKRRLIKLTGGQPDDQAVSTLLHEMAHAATTGNHGMPWKREMIRLRQAGAPLSEPDNRVRLEDWSGDRVSKQHFRAAMQDAVIGLPKIGLTQAIRYFISNEGGASTASAFLKRYPWAREALRQVKREYAEYEARKLKFKHQEAAQRLRPVDGGSQDGKGSHSEAQRGRGKPA